MVIQVATMICCGRLMLLVICIGITLFLETHADCALNDSKIVNNGRLTRLGDKNGSVMIKCDNFYVLNDGKSQKVITCQNNSVPKIPNCKRIPTKNPYYKARYNTSMVATITEETNMDNCPIGPAQCAQQCFKDDRCLQFNLVCKNSAAICQMIDAPFGHSVFSPFTDFYKLQHSFSNYYNYNNQNCAGSNKYLLHGKCLVREGLRVISCRRSYSKRRLMTPKTDSELDEIVEHLKYNPGPSYYDNYRMDVVLGTSFKTGQTLRFEGHITNIPTPNYTLDNHARTIFRLLASRSGQYGVEVDVQHANNRVYFWGSGRTAEYDWENLIGLRNNEHFNLTFSLSYNRFQITNGALSKQITYDLQVGFLDTIQVYGRAELHSVTLDGKDLIFGDQVTKQFLISISSNKYCG